MGPAPLAPCASADSGNTWRALPHPALQPDREVCECWLRRCAAPGCKHTAHCPRGQRKVLSWESLGAAAAAGRCHEAPLPAAVLVRGSGEPRLSAPSNASRLPSRSCADGALRLLFRWAATIVARRTPCGMLHASMRHGHWPCFQHVVWCRYCGFQLGSTPRKAYSCAHTLPPCPPAPLPPSNSAPTATCKP